MKLTIIYDNDVFKKGIGLKSDWGFSCLIENEKEKILFDTGAKKNILLNNMNILNIKPESIDKIIISHEHWDHNGGLDLFKDIVEDRNIYRLKNKIKEKLIKNEQPQQISNKIYTTGKIKGLTNEQSLVLKTNNGCYIVVGCSHPGVEKIINLSSKIGEIKGIIGGFHGFKDFQILKNLDLICPCHCTVHKKKIKNLYPETSLEGGVGKTIIV